MDNGQIQFVRNINEKQNLRFLPTSSRFSFLMKHIQGQDVSIHNFREEINKLILTGLRLWPQ